MIVQVNGYTKTYYPTMDKTKVIEKSKNELREELKNKIVQERYIPPMLVNYQTHEILGKNLDIFA